MIRPPAQALPRRRDALGAAAGLLGAALAGPAWACALEGDDVVLLRSALGVAYPGALNVLAAVSAARRSGRIERWRGLDVPATTDERMAERARIERSLGRLRMRLAGVTHAGAPALSVVLIEPMMWSRLLPRAGRLDLSLHVAGAAHGDVVAVTDEPVIASLDGGRLTAAEALALDLLRLYGRPAQTDAVRAWLDRADAAPVAMSSPAPHRVATN